MITGYILLTFRRGWFGWVMILIKGEGKFMSLKGRLVAWEILYLGYENMLHLLGLMLF